MKRLNQLNVFLVTGAGNKPALTPIDGYPALYRSPDQGANYIPDLLVVGAVDQYGCVTQGNQLAYYVEAYAPGYAVACANSLGGIKPLADGTSICKTRSLSSKNHI